MLFCFSRAGAQLALRVRLYAEMVEPAQKGTNRLNDSRPLTRLTVCLHVESRALLRAFFVLRVFCHLCNVFHFVSFKKAGFVVLCSRST